MVNGSIPVPRDCHSLNASVSVSGGLQIVRTIASVNEHTT